MPLSIGLTAAASIALAPLAVADPPSIPESGSESAAATISDLDAAGYDVNLQFEYTAPNVGLSQCPVTDIDLYAFGTPSGRAGSFGLPVPGSSRR